MNQTTTTNNKTVGSRHQGAPHTGQCVFVYTSCGAPGGRALPVKSIFQNPLLLLTYFYPTIRGVLKQRKQKNIIFMRKTRIALCLSAVLSLAGTVASANVIVGGFTGTNGMETVENVAGVSAPEWSQGVGTFVEVTGTFVQTETAEASVWIRLLDEALPLTLSWHGAQGFQLVAPETLPQNIPAVSVASGPQTVTFRLRVRSLQNSIQRLFLETRQPDGSWLKIFEKNMALNTVRAREWVEEGGVLRVGIAGPVEWLGDSARVRVLRDGTLFLVK